MLGDDKFVTIASWMRTELGLEKSELMVYAIVNGFSQDDVSDFHGTAGYIAEWCGIHEDTALEVLGRLVKKGLLSKSSERDANGHKRCRYTAIRPSQFTGETPVSHPAKDRLAYRQKTGWPTGKTPGRKYRDKNIGIKEPPIAPHDEPGDGIPYGEIVGYLNERSGKAFRETSAATRSLVRARWREGFRLDDFRRVIDTKCAEWGRDPKMAEYVRPSTLFGTKFESYLNQGPVPGARSGGDWSAYD